MMSTANEVAIPIDKLVRTYRRIYEKRQELRTTFEEEESKLTAKIDMVKAALLQHLKTIGADSVRTPEGLIYRTLKTTYWTNDWESMNDFILEHQAPWLLEKRIHQGNFKKFLEENPNILPSGLNVDSEYSVTVRKK
ncbi:MAG: hypothetical protein EBT99_14700 [Betaproteobacteria bacterium]|nr:hypothetical protein [Betaproteobacteria bacterium]